MSNIPVITGSIPAESQQYGWTLALSPQITSVLNFSNPNFGFNSSLSLSEMDISVNQAENTNLIVNQFYIAPAGIPKISWQIYQYIQLNFSQPLTGNANLIFKINKSWILQNNLNFNNITVYKLDNSTNNQWVALSTAYDTQDANFYYYITNVNSFSYFAIGEQANNSIQQPTLTSNTQNQGYSIIVNNNWTLIGIIVIFVILTIIITVICLIIKKKRKIKRIINGEIDQEKRFIRRLKRKKNLDEKKIRNFFLFLKRRERKIFRKFKSD